LTKFAGYASRGGAILFNRQPTPLEDTLILIIMSFIFLFIAANCLLKKYHSNFVSEGYSSRKWEMTMVNVSVQQDRIAPAPLRWRELWLKEDWCTDFAAADGEAWIGGGRL
jgi:hypothetical protein